MGWRYWRDWIDRTAWTDWIYWVDWKWWGDWKDWSDWAAGTYWSDRTGWTDWSHWSDRTVWTYWIYWIDRTIWGDWSDRPSWRLVICIFRFVCFIGSVFATYQLSFLNLSPTLVCVATITRYTLSFYSQGTRHSLVNLPWDTVTPPLFLNKCVKDFQHVMGR